jgi:dTDP-4-amino-4,6-dideoxygalactose transaminase
VDWRVPLSDLDFSSEEETAVLDVLKGRWLTMGAVTQSFERAFAEQLEVKHAVAVSNATVALHLACLALGLGPGDEVIVPSLSFVATASAVLYAGAEVRFADIVGSHELTLSPDEVKKAITPRTKAIMIMHYGGYPCRMDAIMEIAATHGLAVIEDAAHAPGVWFKDKALGAWGDAGCFSFFSNKNLVTGEGGMLVTNRDDIAEKARSLRSHAMTSLTWDRHRGHAYSYDVTGLGYNYRIDEMRAALGLVQLQKLRENNARRQSLTKRYWAELDGCRVDLPFRNHPDGSACHIFPILLPQNVNRGDFIDRLRAAGIQTSIHYPPIHCLSYYRDRYPNTNLPQTEAAAAREVTLPLYSSMGAAAQDMVITAVRNTLKKVQ